MMMPHPIVNGKNIEYDDVYTDFGMQKMKPDFKKLDWAGRVKGILKAELKRRNVSYRELAEKLEAFGLEETERNIANKIARGSFTAVFMVQCFMAIGATVIRLED